MLTDDLRAAFDAATHDLNPTPAFARKLSRRVVAARRRRRLAYAGVPALAAAGSAAIVLAPGRTAGGRAPAQAAQRPTLATTLVTNRPAGTTTAAPGVPVSLSGYRVTLPAEVVRRLPAGAPHGDEWIEVVTTAPDLAGATRLDVPAGATAYVTRIDGRTSVLYRIPRNDIHSARTVWAVLPVRDATPEQVAAWFRAFLDD